MNRKKELEDLIDQVLNQGKSRRIGSIDAKTYLYQQKKKEAQPSDTAELLKHLEKQNEELKQMSKENFGYTDEDFEKLQAEILEDFGCKVENPNLDKIETLKSTFQAFDGLKEAMNDRIIGQAEYNKNLVNAFMRPYVMGIENAESAKNCILISGSRGTGKKSSLKVLVSLMHQRGILNSDDVVFMDLSLYFSKDQEAIFIQDLYMNLKNPAAVMVFQNEDKCYPAFLSMITDLVHRGKVVLSKRYVFNQGQLIEAASGLVKEAISSFSAENKYLVFITEKNPATMMNAFGNDFVSSIQDRLSTQKLTSESCMIILNQECVKLMDRCSNQLNIQLSFTDTARQELLKAYTPLEGACSFIPVLHNMYQACSEVRMESGNDEECHVGLDYREVFILKLNQKEVPLSQYLRQEKLEDIESIKKELNEIVGLSEVKNYVLSLEDYFKVQQLRKKQGLKSTELSKHMIFTGNPGTGKTTIARLISRLMKAVGVLSQGQLVEVTRADLVGRYVGHTAPQTMQIIKSALGGVLFIDEAYALYRGKEDSFGLEAIDTLVKGMEDYRDDLIVILAGYSKEMKEFLESNSGLKSRFPNLIEFPDYTADELVSISLSVAKQKEYRIDAEALNGLNQYYDHIQTAHAKSSGNGRLARNTVETAILNQSGRILKSENAELDLLLQGDFDLEVDTPKA